MEIVLASAAFVVACACAAVMGFAIQRGATCTVAAVDEVLTQRRCTRLAGMAEASLWVAGGLVIAVALGALASLPAGRATSWHTLAGGALLGIGAFVNRACVFGAIARIGSGEWSYCASPVGYFAGCLAFSRFAAQSAGAPLPSPIAAATIPLAGLVLVAAALRLALAWRAAFGGGGRAGFRCVDALRSVWTPHAATTVIGVTFAVMFVLVGAWAYTDALADLASGLARNLAARLALALALLAGAVAGGWSAGRLAHRPATGTGVVRCFAGGALMGAGSLLIPGSNDGLILVGMPLLRPYAWVAFSTMCVTIALAMLATRRLAHWHWAGHGGQAS